MKNRLIIVGDTNTGKTQLIHSKRSLNYEPTSTIGASYVFDLKKDLIDCCWDMSGHPRFNTFTLGTIEMPTQSLWFLI